MSAMKNFLGDCCIECAEERLNTLEVPEKKKKQKKSRRKKNEDEGAPFSVNSFGDNAAAWLEDEPWRTW